jgi:hypothetical protein
MAFMVNAGIYNWIKMKYSVGRNSGLIGPCNSGMEVGLGLSLNWVKLLGDAS